MKRGNYNLNNEVTLGKAYTSLASNTATKEDISQAIIQIDKVNTDLSLGIISKLFDTSTINETRNTNSYNKSLLQTALDSK